MKLFYITQIFQICILQNSKIFAHPQGITPTYGFLLHLLQKRVSSCLFVFSMHTSNCSYNPVFYLAINASKMQLHWHCTSAHLLNPNHPVFTSVQQEISKQFLGQLIIFLHELHFFQCHAAFVTAKTNHLSFQNLFLHNALAFLQNLCPLFFMIRG